MLDAMRKHAQSWMIKGIFAIIIVVFALFFGDFFGWRQQTPFQVVAAVDGSDITLSEYQRAYDNLLNVYRNIFREGLSEETIKAMKLREKALDSIIESRLLLKEAERLGLRVSDSELVDSISRYPAFQKDNAFDRARYLAVLKANRLTPEEFEEGQRRSLLTGKVEDVIKEGIKASDEEVWEEYAGQREKVNLELVRIDPEEFLKDVKVSEDEGKDYFANNKDSFKLPAMARVEFIALNIREAEREIAPTEDQLKRYYEDNIDLFMKPEIEEGARPFEEARGQVAVLFRREKAEDALRERAYRVRGEALKAKGLDEVASGEKLPVARTAFFSQGEPVEGIGPSPDFYREAFALGIGEVSQPVKTSSGYAILRAVERKEPRIPDYGEVKGKVRKALTDKKAKETALKRGEELLVGLREGRLKMSRLPYKTVETGPFTRGNSVPKVGTSGEMNRAAFLLTKGSPYPQKPFSANGAVYIIRLKERVEADRKGFEEEEGVVRARLWQRKGEEALRSWVKVARGKAKVKIYEEFLQ